jgi:hypothetical protein
MTQPFFVMLFYFATNKRHSGGERIQESRAAESVVDLGFGADVGELEPFANQQHPLVECILPEVSSQEFFVRFSPIH